MKLSRSENVEIGNRTFKIRHWGPEDAPVVFMLHGWIDCSASFQFVVDELSRPWHIIAPDWRGHGGSHRTGESYAFLQFVADLDALFERYSPHEAVRIVGHSMGANVSCIYAGVRPERVKCLVNMEGIAPVPGLSKGTAPERLARWLALLRKGARNRPYRNRGEMAQRLRLANPRLTVERADFLAREFSRQQADGTFEFDIDPYQQVTTPIFSHESLVEATWKRIAVPMLLVTAAQSDIFAPVAAVPGLLERRLSWLRQVEHVHLQDAGHNLHHDRPEEVAALIDRFLK